MPRSAIRSISLGADLHFDRRAVRPEQHRVQRLVAVGLGDRDEVAEACVQRLVDRVHHAERVVAVRHRVDDDPETEHVHHLVEAAVLRVHLGVDAPWRLDPADQPVRQASPAPAAAPTRASISAIASRRTTGWLRMRFTITAWRQRIQRAEAEVLQLRLDQVHAQALRDRRVDLQRLAWRCAGAPPAHCAPSVRMLCRRSASLIRMTRRSRDIASSILRKLSAAASWRSREVQLVQLGDAIDQLGHGLAELRRPGRCRDSGVSSRCRAGSRRPASRRPGPARPGPAATATGWVM